MAPQSVPVFITLDDGQLAVMRFFTLARGDTLPTGARWSDQPGVWVREASDLNVFTEISRQFPKADAEGKVLPQPTGYRIGSPGEVPVDRAYRNAWRDNGRGVDHDMPRARELHRNLLRDARAPRLAALDVEYTRADEAANQQEKKRIATERQRLRDVTVDPRIEAATSIEQLKAIGI